MGKFAVKETATGIKFNLLASNGQIIGVSEVYSGKEACLKGIESVKKNAEVANLEDQTVEPIEAATCPKFEILIWMSAHLSESFRLTVSFAI